MGSDWICCISISCFDRNEFWGQNEFVAASAAADSDFDFSVISFISAKNLAVLTRLIEFDSIGLPRARGFDRFVVSFTYRVLATIVDGHRYGGHKLVHIRVHRLVPGLLKKKQYILVKYIL